MNNIPLIIMAAGMSSRMKNSNDNSNLSKDQIFQANNRAKGFIEINEKNETLIYHIIFSVCSSDRSRPESPTPYRAFPFVHGGSTGVHFWMCGKNTVLDNGVCVGFGLHEPLQEFLKTCLT